jgi:hypothetical protein
MSLIYKTAHEELNDLEIMVAAYKDEVANKKRLFSEQFIKANEEISQLKRVCTPISKHEARILTQSADEVLKKLVSIESDIVMAEKTSSYEKIKIIQCFDDFKLKHADIFEGEDDTKDENVEEGEDYVANDEESQKKYY